MKTKISDILPDKSKEIFSVTSKTNVLGAIHLMAIHKIGSVIVMEGERIVGIFTERDYMNKIILEGQSSRKTPVKDVMTPKVAYVTPDTSIEEGLAVMTEKGCRHLPVLEDKKLVAVISMGDLVRQVIDNQKVAIKDLTEYIELSY